MPSKKSLNKGLRKKKLKANTSVDQNHSHFSDENRKTLIQERHQHLEAYHAKRRKKFQERKHAMSKAEKKNFHIKTQHKLDHIANHGKNGMHRDDYDSRHKKLSKEQKEEYKKQRKELNQAHRQKGTYNSEAHLHDLEQHQKHFYEEHTPNPQSDHAGAEPSENPNDKTENKKSKSKMKKRAKKTGRIALRLGKGGVMVGSATAGVVSNAIATFNKAAARDLSGAAQEVHAAFQSSAQNAGQKIQGIANGKNTNSNGVNLNKSLGNSSPSKSDGDATSPSNKGSSSSDGDVSSGPDDYP
jgi:hypothetical protein